MANNKKTLSPALRGALYYTIFFGVVGTYFAYLNVTYLSRGLNGVQIGILNAVGSLMILLSGPFLSNLADKRGWHRQILFFSHLIFGLSILGLHFTSNFVMMILIIATGALFSGPLFPLSDMMVVKMSNRYNLDFGRIRIWGSIGFFIVCSFMGQVWDAIGLQNLFLIGGILFTLRAASTFLLDPIGKVEHDPNESMPENNNAFGVILKDGHFLLFLLAVLLWASCWNTFFAYASIHLDQLGGTSLLVGMMMSLSALGEVPSVFLADRVFRRFGYFRVFIASVFAFIVIMIAVARITNPTVMVIVNGFRGIGFGFFIVGGVRYVDQYAPRIHSGTYQSFYSIITYTVPNLVAMPLMGYLFDNFTIQHVFTAEIIIGFLAMTLFGYLYWQSKQEPTTA